MAEIAGLVTTGYGEFVPSSLLKEVSAPGSRLWAEPDGGPRDNVDLYAYTPALLNDYASVCEKAARARQSVQLMDDETRRLLDEVYRASRLARGTIIEHDLDVEDSEADAISRLQRLNREWPSHPFLGRHLTLLPNLKEEVNRDGAE